jgi:recombination protein RecT
MEGQENMQQAPEKPLSPAIKFSQGLEGNREAIAKQLPRGIEPDRFIRTAITTVNLNPELLQCTPSSLYASFMQAAKDGLMPDGKEAVIQSYSCKIKGENGQQDRWEKRAQYMPMVRGLIQVMYRTGDVMMVDGVAVYEKDHFEYERGDNPRIIHRPYMGMDKPGSVIAAYVVIKLKNGEIKREVMFRRDIEEVRKASKASNGPGWTNWYDQFSIKAVIKRASKQLPTDSEALARVIEHDNEAMDFDFGDKPQAIQQQSVPRIAGEPSRLKSIIGMTGATPEPVVEFAETNQTGANHE